MELSSLERYLPRHGFVQDEMYPSTFTRAWDGRSVLYGTRTDLAGNANCVARVGLRLVLAGTPKESWYACDTLWHMMNLACGYEMVVTPGRLSVCRYWDKRCRRFGPAKFRVLPHGQDNFVSVRTPDRLKPLLTEIAGQVFDYGLDPLVLAGFYEDNF